MSDPFVATVSMTVFCHGAEVGDERWEMPLAARSTWRSTVVGIRFAILKARKHSFGGGDILGGGDGKRA